MFAARNLLALTLLLASCVRLGYAPPDRPTDAAQRDSAQTDAAQRDSGQTDAAQRDSGQTDAAQRDSGQTDGTALDRGPDAPLADGATSDGRARDQAPPREAMGDLSRDASQIAVVPLVNDQDDPLNGNASGSLSWQPCAATFVGEVVVKGLAAGELYQLKLDQSWSAGDPTGELLAGVGRTWDETIWTQGDTADALPAPHTGVGPGNESASNIGDYLSTAEQDALFAAGHQLVGYLVFAHFAVTAANTAELTEDDQSPSRAIAADADGFHLSFEADFSWHTSATPQRGAITLASGEYVARFLITREGDGWHDPLLADGIRFRVGPCP